jgi:hypothetical protein
MVTTAYEVKPESAAGPSDAKPEFNAQSFGMLIQSINGDPDLLKMDWREVVRSKFRLSGDQDRSLVDVPDDRVREIQAGLLDFAEQIRRGATIEGRIIKRPIEEQTPAAVHGIQIELRLPQSAVQPRMLRIAHCDAHCRNWRWNSW